MLGKDYVGQDCGIARTLEVVGERWSLLIVRDAFYGVRRFGELQAHLDIPKAVLAERLRSLVEDGVLTRLPDPDHAGRHLYELTPAGRELWPVVLAMRAWGARHRDGGARRFRHAPCHTLLDDQGECPRCGVVPAAEDVVTEPSPGRSSSREDPVARALLTPHRLLEPLDVRAAAAAERAGTN